MAASLWRGIFRDRFLAFFSALRGNLRSLIWLNILFWGFCFTIVAIGPAVTGMFTVLQKCVTGEKPESILGEFWDSLTGNFVSSFAASIIYGSAVFLLQSAARFFFVGALGGQAWMYLPFVICVTAYLFILVTGFYLFLYLGTGRPGRKGLRECILLTVGYPVSNLAALTLVCGITAWLLRHPLLALWWYPLIGFSFTGLIIVSICYPNMPTADRRIEEKKDAAP